MSRPEFRARVAPGVSSGSPHVPVQVFVGPEGSGALCGQLLMRRDEAEGFLALLGRDWVDCALDPRAGLVVSASLVNAGVIARSYWVDELVSAGLGTAEDAQAVLDAVPAWERLNGGVDEAARRAVRDAVDRLVAGALAAMSPL